jgi:cytochrome bd-type quinol oxidase subunit 2
MTAISTDRTQAVAFNKIPRAALIAAGIGVVGNGIVWLIGSAVDSMAFPLPIVIFVSILGVLIGAALFAILAKFTKRPFTIFTIVSIVFLVLYAFMPINMLNAGNGPIQFNLATVIAAEVMHIISGVAAIWAFNKYPRA